MIAEIANALGAVSQSVADIQQSKQTESCGRQPGILASKSKKNTFNDCMSKAAEAKIIDAQTRNKEASLRSSTDTGSNNKKLVLIGVGVVLAAAITITIVLVLRNKKSSK